MTFAAEDEIDEELVDVENEDAPLVGDDVDVEEDTREF